MQSLLVNQIRTKEGDTLSQIAYEYYGNSIGQVELILAANPWLCKQAALLPPNLMITLPPVQDIEPEIKTLNLWD